MKSKYIKPTLVILGKEIRTIGINGVAYVSARGTTDVFSLDWRTQKRQLEDKDSIILYGVIDISTPEFSEDRESGLTITSKNGVENTDFASQASRKSGYHADREDVIFIRMDRAMMFIAQVSTAHMRAKGNNEGADAILAKRIEFAQALHDYETLGIAINSNYFGQEQIQLKKQDTVLKAVRLLNATESKPERRVVQGMIAALSPELGLSYQPDLIDQQ